MKKILITGANSYVGTNVEKWLMKEPDKYYVETLDMKDPNWIKFDFSKFDVVFHVAGIAHVSTKKKLKELYLKINRDLTIKTAKKAKDSGVKQFIFMSSMIVYNSKEKEITPKTKAEPDNYYGLSKLQAEEGILSLQGEEFIICILRPSMIYGKSSKGNFHKLIKFSQKIKFFPNYSNKRSLLYIDNFARILEKCVSEKCSGIYQISNSDYISTSNIVFYALKTVGSNIHKIKILNYIISLSKFVNIINKVFGDRYYNNPNQGFTNLNLISSKESFEEIFNDEN